MMTRRILAVTAAVSLGVAACGGDDQGSDASGADGSVTSAPGDGQRVVDDVQIGPSDFTDPTRITNPLAPVSEVAYVVMLGDDEGAPLRVEVTVLPETAQIDWEDGSTEVVVAQFIALSDGDLVETADDWFAQDDAGNVWYFGEDVANYEDGEVADTEGSWTAGTDGPPGMLMPASPRVGDVFHSENIPGLVFEEDVVLSVDETIDGPSGAISGVLRTEEHLMEGGVEEKWWAPGYGEFRAVDPGVEDVVVVFALPNDAQVDPVPRTLVDLQALAHGSFDQARDEDWVALAGTLEAMTVDWTDYDVDGRSAVPAQFVDAVDTAMDELSGAVDDEDPDAAAQAAIDLDLAVLDVVMTHGRRPDSERVEALQNQAALAEETGDDVAVANTTALIAAIEARS